MKLTPKNKAQIDGKTYYQLLMHWCNAPVRDPWLQGETGDYWRQRMNEIRAKGKAAHVRASKVIGWNT